MRLIYIIAVLLFSIAAFSQSTLLGKVVDGKGNPVAGANVFLEGTYDGSSSDETGSFSFTTTSTGKQTLVISSLVFENTKIVVDVSNFTNQIIKLRENVTSLDAVVVTAGTMESGDKARVSVLKPLDIVTTAGSAGSKGARSSTW